MSDYQELYKRLAQEILKRDGKLDRDTQTFIKQFAAKLKAEGWQLSGDAETALNAHLNGINAMINQAIVSAVALTAPGLQSEAVLKMAEQAFTERWPDGLTLSDRLWTWKTETRNGVQQQLQAAIRQGKGGNAVLYDMQRTIERSTGGARFKVVNSHADDWVTELHRSAQLLIHDPAARAEWNKVVGEAEERIALLAATGSRSAAERVLDQIKKAVKKGSEALADKAVKWWVYDKQLYNLKRIARTEMATAAHRAVIASVEGDDSVIGFQWRLSGSHKVTDICDYYANIEMGLGKGVWTKEAVPHHKAHPQCMCLLIPRVTAIKEKGSTDYAEFVRNSPPDRRDRLLPKWAKQAAEDGVPLAKLVRADGLGLITRQTATDLINTQTVKNIVAKLAGKTKNANSLAELWANGQAYQKHVAKRVKLGHAKDEADYFKKTLDAMRRAERFNVSGSQQFPVVELIKGNWSVILNQDGLIKTAYEFQVGMESFTDQQIRRGHKVQGYDIRDIGKELKHL